MPALFNTDSIKDANYIKHIDGNSIGNWVVYNDGGATPTDGVGGTPTLTFASSANTSMRGSNNFLLTKSASNQQGQGISYLCNISPADRGKVLRFNFEYLVTSSNYSSGDLTVWFYDVTNGAVIQGAPSSIQNSQLIERFQSEVQVPINCAEMRVIIHVSTATSAVGYTMRFDNFSFGPSEKLYSGQIIDWTPYIPTITHVSGGMTNATVTGRYRKVGDQLEVTGTAKFSAASASFADFGISLPLNLSVDTGKLPTTTGAETRVGNAQVLDSGSTIYNGWAIYEPLSTSPVRLKFSMAATATPTYISSNGLTQAIPITFGANDCINWSFSVPIVGWSSSSQVVSDNFTQRPIAAQVRLSTTVGVTSGVNTKIAFNQVEYDNFGGFDLASNGIYIKTDGVYDIKLKTNSTANINNVAVRIYIDGAEVSANGNNAVNAISLGVVDLFTGYLRAGQLVQGYVTMVGTSPTMQTAGWTTMSVALRQGPSQVLAGESVSCKYTQASGQSIPNNTPTTVVFPTKVWDSHNAMNTSTGVWTAPVSGTYEVDVMIQYNNGQNWAVGTNTYSYIPGTLLDDVLIQIATTYFVTQKGIAKVRLLAGETINFTTVQTRGAATTLRPSADSNRIQITKVGNY